MRQLFTWLRTDKVSGTITCAFGIAMVVFASLGLVVVTIQSVMLAGMPPTPSRPGFPPIIDIMRAMHGAYFVLLPITIAGGIVYAIAGFYVRRGSLVARRVAQANAVVGYLWIAASSISSHRIFDSFAAPTNVLPEPAGTAADWIVIVGSWTTVVANALGAATFPTALLFILSRPGAQASRTPDEPVEQA